MMKFIVGVKKCIPVLAIVLSSCSAPKITNQTDCEFNLESISKDVRAEQRRIKEASVIDHRKYQDDVLTDDDCNGLLFLDVYKWDQDGYRRAYIMVPVLKVDGHVYINPISAEEASVREAEKIEKELQVFKVHAYGRFTPEQLDLIEKRYRNGVVTFPKAYLVH